MKTVFLFAGSHYYPSGGMEDFIGSFNSGDEAQKYIDQLKEQGKWRNDWYDILDISEHL